MKARCSKDQLKLNAALLECIVCLSWSDDDRDLLHDRVCDAVARLAHEDVRRAIDAHGTAQRLDGAGPVRGPAVSEVVEGAPDGCVRRVDNQRLETGGRFIRRIVR